MKSRFDILAKGRLPLPFQHSERSDKENHTARYSLLALFPEPEPVLPACEELLGELELCRLPVLDSAWVTLPCSAIAWLAKDCSAAWDEAGAPAEI